MTTSNTPYAELVKRLDEIGDIAGELQDRVIKELKADPLYRGDPYDAPDDCESNPTIRVGDIRKLLATAPRAARAIEALEAEVGRLKTENRVFAKVARADSLLIDSLKASADRRVEEEREACAQLAVGYGRAAPSFGNVAADPIRAICEAGHEIASAIRSRSNATGEDKAPSPVGFSDEEGLRQVLGDAEREWLALPSSQKLIDSYLSWLARAVITHLSAQRKERGDPPCTCHPDDNPPVPCPRKYAYSECVAAAESAPVQQEGSIAPEALSEGVDP